MAVSFEPPFRAPEAQIPQDWQRLRDHLRAHGLELDLSDPPRQFAGGYACYNYRLRIDGRHVVLRRPPQGPLPRGAYDVGREHRVLKALHPVFPLAPEPLFYQSDPEVLGAPFLIMEYRPGLSVRERLPEGHGGAEVGRRLSLALVRVLATLHTIPPGRIGLGELGRPEGFLARAVEGWLARSRAAFGDEAPALLEEVAAWLRSRVPPIRAVALLHNDFKLDNLLLDPHDLSPRTLVDWDMATRGDPLYDLAVLISYWSEPGDPEAMRRLGQMPTLEPGFLSRSEVVAAYGRESGRDVSDMLFHRVLAMLRLVGIFAQLHRLWRQGSLKGERYREFGDLARGLLDFAWEIARGRAF